MKKNDGEKYGDTMHKLARAERDLARAFRKWDKLRAKLARLGRRLDQHWQELQEVENGK